MEDSLVNLVKKMNFLASLNQIYKVIVSLFQIRFTNNIIYFNLDKLWLIGDNNTSAANIYAVGDVIGKWQLTPGMISSVARTTKCSQLFWKSAY